MKFDILNRWSGKVTQDRLRELFRYDPATGLFTRLTRTARRTQVGDVAGSLNGEGYRQINVDGRSYKTHRLAWLYVYGEWPPALIDHINGQRDDNRIFNLRLAERSDNLANSKVYRNGKALPKGVSFNKEKQKWVARLQRNGRSQFLGSFTSVESASAAYAHAARENFQQFARVV